MSFWVFQTVRGHDLNQKDNQKCERIIIWGWPSPSLLWLRVKAFAKFESNIENIENIELWHFKIWSKWKRIKIILIFNNIVISIQIRKSKNSTHISSTRKIHLHFSFQFLQSARHLVKRHLLLYIGLPKLRNFGCKEHTILFNGHWT